MKRALVSVSDKTRIVEFCSALIDAGYEIVSTGGTFRTLSDAGVAVVRIDDVTGFPEILDGRVKTLHPTIHGGLLALRHNADHEQQLAQHGIAHIDLVAVNLYPFAQTVATGAALEECIEQIDIGGPSMLRSAAKNFASVTVICDPADYEPVIEELRRDGETTFETRAYLARKVFERTASYDAAIASYLATGNSLPSRTLPNYLAISSQKQQDLRYGENPHQAAALYGTFNEVFETLHGKELSYNNIVDIQAAAELVEEFEEPVAAVIKHTNPCGCAVGETVQQAYERALTSDRVSAFGGIVCVNRDVDEAFATLLNEIFTEVIIAPGYTSEAMEILQAKANRRLVKQHARATGAKRLDIKSVANGYLCQTQNDLPESVADWRVATKRQPTEAEWRALSFAWKAVKHVKSNAIVYTNESQVLAVGAGQMSRVDSSQIAVMKAGHAGLNLASSVVGSDAFFPFADGLQEAIAAGATAVIQPGGSVRDQEVIDAADENGIAMVFTGRRHFKH